MVKICYVFTTLRYQIFMTLYNNHLHKIMFLCICPLQDIKPQCIDTLSLSLCQNVVYLPCVPPLGYLDLVFTLFVMSCVCIFTPSMIRSDNLSSIRALAHVYFLCCCIFSDISFLTDTGKEKKELKYLKLQKKNMYSRNTS